MGLIVLCGSILMSPNHFAAQTIIQGEGSTMFWLRDRSSSSFWSKEPTATDLQTMPNLTNPLEGYQKGHCFNMNQLASTAL